MNEEAAGWSVVMTAFQGKWTPLHEAVPRIFGRRGLSTFALVSGRQENLPAEVAADLPEDEARRIVADLADLGASAERVETDRVTDVRYRAHEVWPTRTACGWAFTEVEGMIITESPLSARRNLDQSRTRPGFEGGWRYERGTNHYHARMSDPDREHIDKELKLLGSLQQALREAYPDRRFVLSHMPCNAVSFWQDGPGWREALAANGGPTHEPRDGRAFCLACQGHRNYTPQPGPDPEFPDMEWGTCNECGSEVLVRAWERTRVIGPEE